MARVIGFETLAPGASAIGCTASALQGANLAVGDLGSSVTPPKGGGANYGIFGPVETQIVRWRADGTDPTAAIGHTIAVGGTLTYEGDLSRIRFIAATGTAAVPATYMRKATTTS